jgi:hypothetical protein
MANARQTAHAETWGVEDMVIHNHELVREHIDDLLREGAVLRAERVEAEHRSSIASASGGSSSPTQAGARVLRPARVRLGRWLVAVGWAVAGSPADSRGAGERARPAA